MLVNFFRERTVRGFYFPLVAAILSLISSIVYISSYLSTSYYHITAFLFPLLGFIFFVAMSLFKWTKNYAAIALELFTFLGFIFYIRYIYLYLSTVFYDGISMQAIGNLSPSFVIVLLFELTAVVLSNFAIYIPPVKANKEEIA